MASHATMGEGWRVDTSHEDVWILDVTGAETQAKLVELVGA
jgi:hypothetical protein